MIVPDPPEPREAFEPPPQPAPPKPPRGPLRVRVLNTPPPHDAALLKEAPKPEPQPPQAPPSSDPELLFDELAERLERAAADMGIGEV